MPITFYGLRNPKTVDFIFEQWDGGGRVHGTRNGREIGSGIGYGYQHGYVEWSKHGDGYNFGDRQGHGIHNTEVNVLILVGCFKCQR